jgi:hypothetical protein
VRWWKLSEWWWLVAWLFLARQGTALSSVASWSKYGPKRQDTDIREIIDDLLETSEEKGREARDHFLESSKEKGAGIDGAGSKYEMRKMKASRYG